jgi:integrase
MFEAEEIRQMLAAASPQLKAMILLGINAGLGNTDCGRLPLSALDLERGWLTYPRPKTGVARRCPLWAETVEAIREALAERPGPLPGPRLAGAVRGRALPILTLRFTLTRSGALQRGIVEALTRTAPGLKQEERIDLLTEVLALGRCAADASICRALAGLVAVV